MSCFPPFLRPSALQNVHFLGSESVGPASITVLFWLRIPYLASPDV